MLWAGRQLVDTSSVGIYIQHHTIQTSNLNFRGQWEHYWAAWHMHWSMSVLPLQIPRSSKRKMITIWVCFESHAWSESSTWSTNSLEDIDLAHGIKSAHMTVTLKTFRFEGWIWFKAGVWVSDSCMELLVLLHCTLAPRVWQLQVSYCTYGELRTFQLTHNKRTKWIAFFLIHLEVALFSTIVHKWIRRTNVKWLTKLDLPKVGLFSYATKRRTFPLDSQWSRCSIDEREDWESSFIWKICKITLQFQIAWFVYSKNNGREDRDNRGSGRSVPTTPFSPFSLFSRRNDMRTPRLAPSNQRIGPQENNKCQYAYCKLTICSRATRLRPR